MGRYVGIAGVQMEIDYNKGGIDAMLGQLEAVNKLFPWVDLVLFSELCLHRDTSLAKPIPNKDTDLLCRWAAKAKKWLVPGSMHEKEGRKIYNAAIAISAEGEIVAKYRKLYPWRPLEESDPGKEFCVFEIPGKGRFGLCICYDQWFPEVIRTLAWLGAEVILHPTATYTSDRFLELSISQAQALFNQLYFISINGVGEGGIGRSIFVDPEGHVLQVSGERGTILTEIIDLDMVTRVREYGTLGLSQVLKDFRDSSHDFPVYQKDNSKGGALKSLGPFCFHRKIPGK